MAKKRIKHWETFLKTRAIENQIYVIGVNAISRIKNLKIPGYSLGFSPYGDKLFKKTSKGIDY